MMRLTPTEGRAVRISVGVTVICLGGILTGCGLLGAGENACPETVSDPEGGVTDGIDLALPEWLAPGFPVPEGTSIRHINNGTPAGRRVITGFIPGGDGAPVVERMSSDLRESGYELLLAADGFHPIANAALAALDPGTGVVVWFDTAAQQAPVRVDDECPWQDGLLVGIQFEQTTAAEARERFAGSSLTFGSARAVVGEKEFTAEGECLVLDGAYTFSAVTGAGIGLQFDTTYRPPPGWASVDVEGEVSWNLDLDRSGVNPEFGVSASGFSIKGMFIDGLGDQGIVEGHIEATCPW